MDTRKIEKAGTRNVTVLCPKCRHSRFMSDEKLDRHICQKCKTEFTGEQLQEVTIAKEISSITKDITNAIGDEISKSIKKTFKNQ